MGWLRGTSAKVTATRCFRSYSAENQVTVTLKKYNLW